MWCVVMLQGVAMTKTVPVAPNKPLRTSRVAHSCSLESSAFVLTSGVSVTRPRSASWRALAKELHQRRHSLLCSRAEQSRRTG
jgi:hypothetical protein